VNYFSTLLRLLRDRQGFLIDVQKNIRLEGKMIALLVCSTLFFAIYGAIIGSSSSWLQMISSAIKLPALYLVTLIICLPTLYFFDILFGSGLAFAQYVTLMLSNMAVISVLLFSFAPVTLFFLISIPGYNFFLLINVAVLGITGIVGVRLFYQGMISLAVAQTVMDHPLPAIAPQKPKKEFADETDEEDIGIKDADDGTINPTDQLAARKRLLQAWLVLYALVGSQLGWTLRPFFGAPGEPFQIFRSEIDGNFYLKVIQTFYYFVIGG
jgi:hypothetical protein